MARYTIIAAIDEEGGIGKDGGIPWDYPADRKFFRDTTMGHTVVVGRKTLATLPHLPNRKVLNIEFAAQSLTEHAMAMKFGERISTFVTSGQGYKERNLVVMQGSVAMVEGIDYERDGTYLTLIPGGRISSWQHVYLTFDLGPKKFSSDYISTESTGCIWITPSERGGNRLHILGPVGSEESKTVLYPMLSLEKAREAIRISSEQINPVRDIQRAIDKSFQM